MKKKIALVLTAALVAGLALAGCGNKEEAGTDDSLNKVTDKGELVVGLDPAFPPMGYKDDEQNLVGFDLDLAKEVSKRLDVKMKAVSIDWDTKEQELETESIDCIWNGFSSTPEREEQLTLSESYMTNTQVAVVLKDSEVETLKQLKDKTVIVQESSSAEDAIEGMEDFKDSLKDVISVNDNVQAMLELGQNGADAVVMDKVVAMYYMEKQPDKYRVLEESLADENYVIGFKKGNDKLCSEVENQLKDMAKDGTLAEISEKWFGKDITSIK